MAFRICTPDTIFFNLHALYTGEIVLFFAILITSTFAVISYGLTCKSSEAKPFLFENYGSTLDFSVFLLSELSSWLLLWASSLFMLLVLSKVSSGYCMSFSDCLLQPMTSDVL